MKQNLVVLLADLFNLFEIHPAKCVAYPGMDQQLPSKFGIGNFSIRFASLFLQIVFFSIGNFSQIFVFLSLSVSRSSL